MFLILSFELEETVSPTETFGEGKNKEIIK